MVWVSSVYVRHRVDIPGFVQYVQYGLGMRILRHRGGFPWMVQCMDITQTRVDVPGLSGYPQTWVDVPGWLQCMDILRHKGGCPWIVWVSSDTCGCPWMVQDGSSVWIYSDTRVDVPGLSGYPQTRVDVPGWSQCMDTLRHRGGCPWINCRVSSDTCGCPWIVQDGRSVWICSDTGVMGGCPRIVLVSKCMGVIRHWEHSS